MTGAKKDSLNYASKMNMASKAFSATMPSINPNLLQQPTSITNSTAGVAEEPAKGTE